MEKKETDKSTTTNTKTQKNTSKSSKKSSNTKTSKSVSKSKNIKTSTNKPKTTNKKVSKKETKVIKEEKKVKPVKEENNKKEIKKKRKVKRDVKFYIIEAIFLIIMLVSIFKIIAWWNDNHKSKKNLDEVTKHVEVKKDDKGEEEYKVDFNKLKEKNPDTVAYIKVNGTKIEYPIVKTDNNEYYLVRSFDKTYNEAGWPFANFVNKLDGTDKNITLFGHARLDGSMFGTLKDTLKSEWQSHEENFKIKFITETEESEYQVFSTYKIEVEDYYIEANFATDQEFETFINTIKSRSNIDYGVDVSVDDQVLTLSSCDINNDYRIVLHAKKIK